MPEPKDLRSSDGAGIPRLHFVTPGMTYVYGFILTLQRAHHNALDKVLLDEGVRNQHRRGRDEHQ